MRPAMAGKPNKIPPIATRIESTSPDAVAVGSSSGTVFRFICAEAYAVQKRTDPLRPRADRRDRERCRIVVTKERRLIVVATLKELLLLRGLLLGRLLGGLLLRWHW